KIEAGKMSVEPIPFSVSSVVGGVADTLTAKARDKSVTLIYRIDDALSDTLIGDPGRLRQILLNLTDNALKFTKEGTVTLKVLHQQTENNISMVHFAVSDTGIGLSEQGKKRLFQPFSQADSSTTRKYGGTGLGLSICARLIALMKGEIILESELGKGSTFSFSIPLPIAAPLVQRSSPSSPGKALKYHDAKVLLVEDNAVNQRVASLHLKKMGIAPDVKQNGQEAVDAVQEQGYDIIFMDCQMPVMDGFVATERIRAFEAEKDNQHQTIVAMTANAMKGDKERCLAAGMDDYLSKPISAAALSKVLQHWLNDSESIAEDMVAAVSGASLLDLSYLEEMFGDDKETILELFTLFLENAEGIILQMQGSDDAEAVKALAHELKGSSSNMGVKSMTDVAAYIERHAEDDQQAKLVLLQQHIVALRSFVGTEFAS
ncbi:MAG: ATP-binding protein, partial [Ghiorsea sp.]